MTQQRETDEDLGILTPLAVTIDKRGVRSVQIRCNLCGNRHTHGWPVADGDRSPGFRSAHCGLGSYSILAPRSRRP